MVLFRGVSVEQHEQGRALTPKSTESFEHAFRYDGTIRYDGNATYGVSTLNAVVQHQMDQAGFPTSGISTTPHRLRAIYYATKGGTREGVIYTLSRAAIESCGGTLYDVNKLVVYPSVPEDEEVVIVLSDPSSLSLQTIVVWEHVAATGLA